MNTGRIHQVPEFYKTTTYQTYTTRQEQNLPRTGIIECIAYQNLPSPNLLSLKLYKTIIYLFQNLPNDSGEELPQSGNFKIQNLPSA